MRSSSRGHLEPFLKKKKNDWNETAPVVLQNFFQRRSASSVRLPFERNDRSEWNGPHGTAKFLRGAWGERGLTFRLNGKRGIRLRNSIFSGNFELHHVTFQPKIPVFVKNGKRPWAPHNYQFYLFVCLFYLFVFHI